MKNKKIILEQSNPQKFDLTQSVKYKCFDAYNTWFDIDPGIQPKKTTSGISVVSGKNKKGETVFFYENGVVKNLVTKLQKKWSCSQVDSMNQNQTKNSVILSNFGLTSNDAEKAKQTTTTLQGLIERGAVSDIFQKWNEVLTNVFQDTTLLKKKVGKDNKDIDWSLPAKTSDLQIKYDTTSPKQLNSEYGWKNVLIYLPQAAMETPTNVDVNLDPTTCDTILKTYLKSAFQYSYNNVPARPDVLKMQGQINSCYGSGMYNSFTGITKNDYPGVPNDRNPFKLFRNNLRFEFIVKLLRGDKNKYLSSPSPYLFHIGGIKNESVQNELKTMIKESLYQSSKLKKQNLITESNIIQNRTKFLIEGRTLKTESQRNKFFNEILIESNYLNSQGFGEQLINEQFWDALKGLFGTGAEGTFQYFKEYLAKQLITKLTPLDTDGWIGGVVIKAIGNVGLTDVGKLTNCNFLVPVLTKSIVEEAADKIKKSVGMTGPFYDILRNSLAEMVEDSEFGQSIERNLSTLICPLLGGVKSKIETATDKMKEKVLSK